jgi:hypothetical protein
MLGCNPGWKKISCNLKGRNCCKQEFLEGKILPDHEKIDFLLPFKGFPTTMLVKRKGSI